MKLDSFETTRSVKESRVARRRVPHEYEPRERARRRILVSTIMAGAHRNPPVHDPGLARSQCLYTR